MEIASKVKEERKWGFEDVNEEEELKPLTLSINAIKGVTEVSSIRLIGKINGRQVGFYRCHP